MWGHWWDIRGGISIGYINGYSWHIHDCFANILNNIIYIYIYGITWVCLWKLEDLPPICGQSTGENHDQAVDTMIYGYPVCRQTHIWMSKHHERSGSHYLCTWPPQVLTLGFKSPIFKRIQVCESVSVGVQFPEIKVGHFQRFQSNKPMIFPKYGKVFWEVSSMGGAPQITPISHGTLSVCPPVETLHLDERPWRGVAGCGWKWYCQWPSKTRDMNIINHQILWIFGVSHFQTDPNYQVGLLSQVSHYKPD